MTTYHVLEVNGLHIFYRKGGNPDKPAIFLLHGFPSASHMFRDLIPVLGVRNTCRKDWQVNVRFLKT